MLNQSSHESHVAFLLLLHMKCYISLAIVLFKYSSGTGNCSGYSKEFLLCSCQWQCSSMQTDRRTGQWWMDLTVRPAARRTLVNIYRNNNCANPSLHMMYQIIHHFTWRIRWSVRFQEKQSDAKPAKQGNINSNKSKGGKYPFFVSLQGFNVTTACNTVLCYTVVSHYRHINGYNLTGIRISSWMTVAVQGDWRLLWQLRTHFDSYAFPIFSFHSSLIFLCCIIL